MLDQIGIRFLLLGQVNKKKLEILSHLESETIINLLDDKS